jgi:hypothetical protein
MVLPFVLLAWIATAGATDCNLNGVDDATEIAGGAADCNANGVPDACDLFPLGFTRSTTPAGSFPAALVAAELNGDGIGDLAVANRVAGTVTILSGAADGTFTSAGTVTVGARPEAIAAAVLDTSGGIILLGSNTDLVVANGDANTVSVLRNNGDGTFTDGTGSPFTVPGHPNGLAILDVTGDGAPEIAISIRDGGGVRALLNDGMGNFTGPFSTIATGTGPQALVAADVDLDGNADLLIANRGSGTVALLRGTGTNIVGPATTAATVSDPAAMAVADLDADGDLDLGVLSGTDAAVHIFLNDGTGTFTAAGTVRAGSGGTALRLVDVDGNGAPDVVAVSSAGNAVVLALNDGTGHFNTPVAFPAGTGPLDVAAADVDGDGRTDVLASDSVDGTVSILHGAAAVARDCDASGVPDACEAPRLDCNANGVADTCDAAFPIAFGLPVFTSLADAQASRAAVFAAGDVDGDGRTDVVLSGTGSSIVVARGAADGTVAEVGSAFPLADEPTRVLLVDVDGDGDRDFVVATAATMTVYVLRNTGSGTIGAADSYVLPNVPNAIVAGEFTGDGVLDLAAAYSDVNSLVVLAGTAGGMFAAQPPVALAGRGTDLVAGDVDGDGDTDLVTLLLLPGGITEVQVIRNDAGTLVAEAPILAQTPPTTFLGLTGGDFDGDGDLDLALLELDPIGELRVRIARASGGTYTLVQALGFASGIPPLGRIFPGILGSLPVADFDRDGRPDLAFPALGGNGAFVYRNHGDGTFEPARAVPFGRRVLGLAAGDATGDGAPDLVAQAAGMNGGAVVVPGLARPDVDVNRNGIADCHEELRCNDCADDDGDGLIDAADPDCPAGALAVRQVAIRPAHRRQAARAKVVADVPVALTLDPAATAFGMTVAAAETYCGTPGLRRKGRHTLRLAAADHALTGLVLQAGKRGVRARATISPVTPAPNVGDVVRLWMTGGGQSFRGEATLRKKGKTLVGR